MANVGADKDSDKRQRQAIAAFAKRSGLELVGEFTDAAVSGADHIETRPGFTAMLAYIASNGARTIIVETASRFARDLMVQEFPGRHADIETDPADTRRRTGWSNPAPFRRRKRRPRMTAKSVGGRQRR